MATPRSRGRFSRVPRLRGAHRVLLGAMLLSVLAVATAQDAPPDEDAPPDPAEVLQPDTGLRPRVNLSVSPLSGTSSTVFFASADAQGSPLPNGTMARIVKYEWDWNGTGEWQEGGRRDRFSYGEDGEYVVAVRVTDETGATAESSRQVRVGEPRTGLRWDVVTDNLPGYWQAAKITLYVSIISILAGLPIGIFVGLARISKIAPVRWVAAAYIEFLRGTPLLVQIFIIVFALPQFGISFGALTGGIIALTINTSAYQAEIIRSGIQAIPSGQMEAAMAMGLTNTQAMKEVILPQALRLVIPPLTNEFIILIKDSSLVSVLGVIELMGFARLISQRTFRFFEPLVAVAVMYFIMTYSLSLFLQWVERKLAIPGLGLAKKEAH